jgi:hypothetical protein
VRSFIVGLPEGIKETSEGFDQLGAGAAQLLAMDAGEAVKNIRAFVGEADADQAAILSVADALDEAASGQAVDEADDAVMAKYQVIGELADAGRAVLVKAFDGKEQLMLLRLQPLDAGGLLAEVEEAADFVAEVAEGAVIGAGEKSFGVRARVHDLIISHYDIHVNAQMFQQLGL